MGTNFGFLNLARRNSMTQQPELRPPMQTAGNAMFPMAGQQDNRAAQFNAMQPSTPAAPGFTEAPGNNAMSLRVNPNYLPEQWDYTQSPEYQQRLAWAQRDLNRQLLSMGRADSTGGINAMARQQGEIAGQEIDKQYQRALQANMENYNRMLGSNQINYGRTVGEDQTGWNRAWDVSERDRIQGNYVGEQDWSRNYQLAGLGYDATRTGVYAGNQTGSNLANLLSGNGATQASLALSSGAVSADTISRLLNSGFSFDEIEKLFGGGGTAIPSPVSVPQTPNSRQLSSLPTGQVPGWMMQQTDFFS